MAAPTFQAEYEVSSWTTTTTPKTTTPTTSAGDVLAIGGLTADQPETLGAPTGNSVTYTERQLVNVASYARAYVWTGTDASGGSGWTLSVSRTAGTGPWGHNTLRFSGSDGVGASNKANADTAAPSLSLTTTQDNSAIVAFVADWNAVDGASRTWRTINSITPTAGNGLEVTYARDASFFTVYGAYWNDVGAAGAKTVGISSPSTMKYALVAVEIKGSTTAAGRPVPPVLVAQAVNRAAVI